jgi:hypothetical protein
VALYLVAEMKVEAAETIMIMRRRTERLRQEEQRQHR